MIVQLVLSIPSSSSSSSATSFSFWRNFFFASIGNQSAMKLSIAQSILAETAVSNCNFSQPQYSIIENALRLAESTVFARHMGQWSCPRFCIFTRHLMHRQRIVYNKSRITYRTQKRCLQDRRIGLKAMLVHMRHA